MLLAYGIIDQVEKMKKTDQIDLKKLMGKLVDIVTRDEEGLSEVAGIAGSALAFMVGPTNNPEALRVFVGEALKKLDIDPESVCKNVNLN
jgi:hypothetical protein